MIRRLFHLSPAIVASVCVACAPQPKPTAESSTPKPVAKQAAKPEEPPKAPNITCMDVLDALYTAKINLDLLNRDKAYSAIKQANAQLSHFRKKAPDQSSLLVELTYFHQGTKTQLYIPSYRTSQRFDPTREALEQLQRSGIKPKQYRLVTYDRNISIASLRQPLQEASNALKATKESDKLPHASMKAERDIDRFYQMLNIKNYTGEARRRLAYHTLATHAFLSVENYDLAREASDQAEDALSDFRLTQQDKNMAQRYEAYLAALDQAIERKDPTMMTKMEETVGALLTKMIPK